jgi:hypothetical protein
MKAKKDVIAKNLPQGLVYRFPSPQGKVDDARQIGGTKPSHLDIRWHPQTLSHPEGSHHIRAATAHLLGGLAR